jgi:hypothetical protein
VIALLAIAMLMATQPLGVLSHVVHDHLADHAQAPHDGVAIHLDDADHGDHDAGHAHVWTTPAATVEPSYVSQLSVTAAVGAIADLRWPSASPFPPFSPPRA